MLPDESPGRVVLNAVGSSSLIPLPEIEEEVVEEVDEKDDSDDDAGDFIFVNSSGDTKSYLELSVGTLNGLMINEAQEKKDLRVEQKSTTWKKILVESAEKLKEKHPQAINASNIASKMLDELTTVHGEEEAACFMEVFGKIAYHYHTLPKLITEQDEKIETIEKAIVRVTKKARDATDKRSADKRKAKVDAVTDDVEHSSVARYKKAKAPLLGQKP